MLCGVSTPPVDPSPELAPHPVLADYYGDAPERPHFVQRLFDATAPSYDRIERLIGFGSGPWYRHDALTRAGLQAGMRVLDVAVGTGLVAREAITVAGESGRVWGSTRARACWARPGACCTCRASSGSARRFPCARRASTS